MNPGPSNPSNRSSGPIVDDQQSTEPIPEDFDYRAAFMPSSPMLFSPPDTRQDAPVTRARARAQAQAQTLDHIENNNSIDSAHDVNIPKSRVEKGEYSLLLRSTRRDSPISKTKLGVPSQRIDGFDGSAEEHSSANAEGQSSSALEADNSNSDLSDNGDDEYCLPESENGSDDSELSTIGEILSKLKTKTTKKHASTTKSTRRNKQVSKIAVALTATKKLGGPSTSKATGSSRKHPMVPNQVTGSLAEKSIPRDKPIPISRRIVKASVESGDPMASVTIPDSQDISQEPAAPSTTKQKSSNSRRPKKPFYPDNLNEQQAKLQAASSICSDADINQQSIVRQGEVDNCSFGKMKSAETKIAQVNNQGKDSILDTMPSEAHRGRDENDATPPVDKGRGHAINHSQNPIIIDERSDSSPSVLLSDDNLQPIVMDYGETHPHNSPFYGREAQTSKRPSDPVVDERPTKKVKVCEMEISHDNVDVPTRAYLPQLSVSSPCYQRVGGSPDERAQADVFEAKPLPPKFFIQGPERKAESAGDKITKYQFSRSLRAHDTSGSPRTKHVTAGAGDKCQREENPEPFPSVKVHGDYSDTESLHPASRAWAQHIAKRSRKKDLTSMPLKMTEGTEPQDEAPIMTQEFGKNPTSKREITLATRRRAVFESVHEVTTAVLQHMQSKESTLDEIVENYQRNGRKLIDTLLDRQVVELREVVSSFDNKCARLGNMFAEGVRLARAVHKRVSSRDDQYSRAWNRRNKDLAEGIKKAWEAVESI
ncbi:hypothetical protein F5Y09DRAFT_355827 [Xylaria sp. FL1042]|nr:hypothetical protein F5Y09DRAFT_355827 [Xylaria sp. FL1042]